MFKSLRSIRDDGPGLSSQAGDKRTTPTDLDAAERVAKTIGLGGGPEKWLLLAASYAAIATETADRARRFSYILDAVRYLDDIKERATEAPILSALADVVPAVWAQVDALASPEERAEWSEKGDGRLSAVEKARLEYERTVEQEYGALI